MHKYLHKYLTPQICAQKFSQILRLQILVQLFLHIFVIIQKISAQIFAQTFAQMSELILSQFFYQENSEEPKAWFVEDKHVNGTRRVKRKFKESKTRLSGFRKSALPYLYRLLNEKGYTHSSRNPN